MSRMQSLRNDLFTEVATLARDTVRDYGLPPEVAEQVGAAVADALADHWRGQIVSIPTNHAYRLSERDQKLLEELRQGTPIADLVTRYKITNRAIRLIRQRALLRDANLNQQQLFSEG